ncbi:MAG TPA: ATP-dependent DNA ligase, partial [Allosphingosinicella sp.]
MKPERIVEGVRLSNPDKILYPEQGITKSRLADYYVAVADRMLPHVAFRPVTMVRCPTGEGAKCFYQRHAGSGVLEQLHEVAIPGFDEPYLYISDAPGLV